MARITDKIPWRDNSVAGCINPAIIFPKPPKRNMLSGVKQQLYHPYLPTLRQMDMDTVLGKLPEEHCQTSTFCTKDDFTNAHFNLLGVPNKNLHGLEFTGTGQMLKKRFQRGMMTPLAPCINQMDWPCHSRAIEDWTHFVSNPGEFKLPFVDKKAEDFDSYAVRYLKPDITQCWRYYFNQNPSFYESGQQPMPNDTTNSYRSFRSPYRQVNQTTPWH